MATAGKLMSRKGGRAEKTAGFAQAAERLRRRGKLEQAVEACERGLEEFPDNLSGRVTLGWALLDLGRFDQARVELEAVLKRAPDNLTAIRGLAELHDRAESTLPLDMETPADWPAAQETEGFDAAALVQNQEDDEASETPDMDGLVDEASALLVVDEALATDVPVPQVDLAEAPVDDVSAEGGDSPSAALDSAVSSLIPDALAELGFGLASLEAGQLEDGVADVELVGEVGAGLAEPDLAEVEELVGEAPGIDQLVNELAVVESVEFQRDLEVSSVDPPEAAADDAEAGVATVDDLSDAAAAFELATEETDESRDPVFTAPTDALMPDAAGQEAESAGLDESTDLLEGHADAEELADDMAAYAGIDPGPDEATTSASDLLEASSLDDSAGFGGADVERDLSSHFEPQHIASGEPEAEGSDPHASLADLDHPLIGGEGDATEFEEVAAAFAVSDHEDLAGHGSDLDLSDEIATAVDAAEFEAAAAALAPSGPDDPAGDESGFDLSTEITAAQDAPEFEGYAAPAADDFAPAADQVFDAARDAAAMMAAEAESGHADLVAEIAAASVLAAADAADEAAEEAHDSFTALEVDPEQAAATEAWTPPAPATSPGPASDDPSRASAASLSLDDAERSGVQIDDALDDAMVPGLAADGVEWMPPVAEAPVQFVDESGADESAFSMPVGFDAKAVARMEASDELLEPTLEVDPTASLVVTDVLGQTPLHRLERLLGRVQASRLRQAIKTVA